MTSCFKVFLKGAETAGHKVKAVRCDGGGEFDNADFRDLKDHGMSLRINLSRIERLSKKIDIWWC